MCRPGSRVVGGGRLPATAPSRRPLTLRLAAEVSIGDGTLDYAPTGGRRLADWDFIVETD